MDTSVFLSSPSWDKASYVEPPVWKVGVDTTLSVWSDKKVCLWSSFNPEFKTITLLNWVIFLSVTWLRTNTLFLPSRTITHRDAEAQASWDLSELHSDLLWPHTVYRGRKRRAAVLQATRTDHVDNMAPRMYKRGSASRQTSLVTTSFIIMSPDTVSHHHQTSWWFFLGTEDFSGNMKPVASLWCHHDGNKLIQAFITWSSVCHQHGLGLAIPQHGKAHAVGTEWGCGQKKLEMVFWVVGFLFFLNLWTSFQSCR